MQEPCFDLIPHSADIESLISQVKTYAEVAKAPATRKAYAADICDYRDFCARTGLPLFAPGGEVLALYVADLARREKSWATIFRRVATLSTEYHAAGHRETPASSFLDLTPGCSPNFEAPSLCTDPLHSAPGNNHGSLEKGGVGWMRTLMQS